MGGERLIDDERNNPCVFLQTCLAHFHPMTTFVFPAATAGTRGVSHENFHDSSQTCWLLGQGLFIPTEIREVDGGSLTFRLKTQLLSLSYPMSPKMAIGK
jgi:hypothetical protein